MTHEEIAENHVKLAKDAVDQARNPLSAAWAIVWMLAALVHAVLSVTKAVEKGKR